MCLSCPHPAALSSLTAACPRTGPGGTPSCSVLHCWTEEWNKWEVDEGGDRQVKLLMEIMRDFVFCSMENIDGSLSP